LNTTFEVGMNKLATAMMWATLCATGAAFAADSPPANAANTSKAAERQADKADWLAECVSALRSRDASLMQDAATATCKNRTGSGSATRATMPGHSEKPDSKTAAPAKSKTE
jgi:hypothetical protein